MHQQELKRAVAAAVAQSQAYTDKAMADHVRENTIGGVWMAVLMFVFQAVVNVAIAIAVLR